MRAALTVLLMLTAVEGCASRPPGGAEAPPAGETQALSGHSASLLRRLAEAADGYRDGVDRYIVAAREFPHKVAGVFETRAEAETVAATRSTETEHYEVFGPVRTAVEAVAPPDPKDVDSVTVHTRDGKAPKTYSAENVDALFWSLAAFDKFVAPYLTHVYGVAEAARQRELYRIGKSPLANSKAIPHYRGSF